MLYTSIVDRFPLPPGPPPIGDTSLTHVMIMKVAAHSTNPPTLTTMVQYFMYKAVRCGLLYFFLLPDILIRF
jgi:hypothetical protein